MKKVAVVLSGCGHLDGAEIREAVITLLELDRKNAHVEIFAPDKKQSDVINHLDNSKMVGERNVLIEAARIARGKIRNLKEAKVQDFDALIMPGGFGVAKNLSDVAFKGGDGVVIDELKELIRGFVKAKKPIGAICISPAIIASALQGMVTPTLTLGEHNQLLQSFNAVEEICSAENIVIDQNNMIISSPAYMRNERLSKIATGIEKLVTKVLELA